ncbi:phage tail sheath C-terminal domain-containing protein [Hymenobacter cheonanensis]|uniref:phage tail sheath C-terminal domain-containing protein n=1 Tax=Hymenobacter sp. CA2-7 TaxID=3063993 RepID=UPI00271295B3|nr:phage tail sheath C-terminal domain-containing protein [Hymenobacter sp. CA2-7]MDO7883964.1 phage tail sheath C-terminal domain-containing protein [Hymenobacter sp. CA2-7]
MAQLAPYHTPGVTIVEQNAFPDSVVEVATAIPAFVGYTEKASYKGKPLANVPTRVESLQDFVNKFGGKFTQVFDLVLDVVGSDLQAGTLTGGTLAVTSATGTTTADITGGSFTGATYASPTGTPVTGALTGAALQGATVTIAITGKLTAGQNGTTDITGNDITAGTLTGGTLANIAVQGSTVTADLTGGTITGASYTPSGGQPVTGATVTAAALTGAPVVIAIQKGTFTAGTVASDPAALPAVTLTFASGRTAALTPQGTGLFYLYNSLQLFYQNGGGPCYIVSIGGYDATPTIKAFEDGIDLLEPEQDPTMLLCPDALRLTSDDYTSVMQHMLQHCADVQKRVALLDVYGGDGPGSLPTLDDIDTFRTNVGVDYLNYGITYFPWVNTTVVEATDLSFRNLTPNALAALASLVPPPKPATNAPLPAILFGTATTPPASPSQDPEAQAKAVAADLALNNKLKAISPEYKLTLDTMAAYLGTLPVAPAMAGVYTAVDSSRGVWKAPANVSLNAVIKPTVAISDAQQAGLNVDAMTGKSINAIRAFKGLGNLVWGARTLDGNSQDWRYVNVRRTMIMIEQSMKLAARNTVFEPNDANTWVTFKSMLNSFLFNLWKQGALAGAKPDDAYSVQVGLGTTMTADDILNGIMNVTVLVALVRPAEFITLTFKQQMQVS